jgi:2-isopropylmalate synthase
VQAVAESIGQQKRGKQDPPIIAGLARAREADIRRCGDAVKLAKRGRIHTFIATSPIHMEKKLRMTPKQVIAAAVDAVKLARSIVPDVEFSCEDAGRTDWGFMVEIVTAVIEAGAGTINIPDTVGYTEPEQYGACIANLLAKVPNVKDAIISVHCHNDLGMAVANSLAAVKNGARQVECTINGIGERAGNASLEEIVMNLMVRQDYFGVTTGINTKEIYRCSKLVQEITGQRVQANKAIVGANAFAHEAGIHQDGVLKERTTYEIMTAESVGWAGDSMVMGKHSGRHAFKKRLEGLGFQLADAELDVAFGRFKEICDKKKEVYDDDLYAIVGDSVHYAKPHWELIYVHVVSGTDTIPTATVKLRCGDKELVEAAMGDGPVDAAFRAIERAVGLEVRLQQYQLDAVTSGKDALGRVTVTVAKNGYKSRARGVSTDIVVASAKAFINALNAIAFQEARSDGKAPAAPSSVSTEPGP